MLSEFMTIQDAMDSGLIPESYHDLFINYTTCPDEHCLSPLIINRNRTVMKCSNPNCPKILAARVLKVYSRFGLENLGPKFAYNWVVGTGIHSVPEALLNPPNDIANAILAWFDMPHTTGEIIEMLAIPGIGSKGTKMMGDIRNYKEFCAYIDVCGRQVVMHKCGFRGTLRPEWWNALMQAIKLNYPWESIKGFIAKNSETNIIPYNSNKEFMDDVLFEGLSAVFKTNLGGTGKDGENAAESVFLHWDEVKAMFNATKCYPGNIETRKIIITGDITAVLKEDGTAFDRLEFIDYVNKYAIMAGVRYQNSTAFASSEFVIADYPSNTNKYKRGKAMGNLLTSKEFLELIKKRVKEYAESNNS